MGTCDSTTTKAITEKLIHHYFGVPILCLGWQRSAGPTESWDPTHSWPSCTVRLLFALIRAWPRCHDPLSLSLCPYLPATRPDGPDTPNHHY